MNLKQIESKLSRNKKRLDGFGVKSLMVFGSVARSEEHKDSDIDILVEFNGPATFHGYMGLSEFLERLLGRKVDLVTTKALREPLREGILREAIRVA